METTVMEQLKKLRAPFPDNQVSILCRSTKKDNPKAKCNKCGGFHGMPAIQLHYVGHAALTDRLLEVDPTWTWEPMAVGPEGYPVIDKDGGMWIKLTVCGVTRLGYGDAQGKTGGDAMKERIGDALRNAAMRFGAALDLWHKGDLHAHEHEDDEPVKQKPQSKQTPKTQQQTTQQQTINQSLTEQEVSDVKLAMKECTDIDALMQMFASAYKKASPEQQKEIKAAYDAAKAQFTQSA